VVKRTAARQDELTNTSLLTNVNKDLYFGTVRIVWSISLPCKNPNLKKTVEIDDGRFSNVFRRDS